MPEYSSILTEKGLQISGLPAPKRTHLPLDHGLVLWNKEPNMALGAKKQNADTPLPAIRRMPFIN